MKRTRTWFVMGLVTVALMVSARGDQHIGGVARYGSGDFIIERFRLCRDITSPASDLTTSHDIPSLWKFDDDHGVTVQKVVAEVTACDGGCTAETVTLNLQRDDGSPGDVLTADLVADVGGQSSCASGCDVATIDGTESVFDVGDDMDFSIVSLDAGVRGLTICVFGVMR